MDEKEIKDTFQEASGAEISQKETGKDEEIIERPYKLRRLKDKDLFPLLKILRKIKIRDYKEAFIQTVVKKAPIQNTESETDSHSFLEQVGIMTTFDIAAILIENLPDVLTEAYELWSDISGIPVEEIEDMEFGTLPLMIIDTFSEAKNTSFFKVLSKFLS